MICRASSKRCSWLAALPLVYAAVKVVVILVFLFELGVLPEGCVVQHTRNIGNSNIAGKCFMDYLI